MVATSATRWTRSSSAAEPVAASTLAGRSGAKNLARPAATGWLSWSRTQVRDMTSSPHRSLNRPPVDRPPGADVPPPAVIVIRADPVRRRPAATGESCRAPAARAASHNAASPAPASAEPVDVPVVPKWSISRRKCRPADTPPIAPVCCFRPQELGSSARILDDQPRRQRTVPAGAETGSVATTSATPTGRQTRCTRRCRRHPDCVHPRSAAAQTWRIRQARSPLGPRCTRSPLLPTASPPAGPGPLECRAANSVAAAMQTGS